MSECDVEVSRARRVFGVGYVLIGVWRGVRGECGGRWTGFGEFAIEPFWVSL
jgi:hypothetical protein